MDFSAVSVCVGCADSIVELNRSGVPERRVTLPEDLQNSSFSSFVVIPQVTLPLLAITSIK